MMKRNLFGLFGVSMACFMIVGAGCAAEHKDLLYSFDVPLGAEFDYNSVSAQLQTEGFIKDDQYQAIKAKANGALQADDFATTLSSNAATIKDTIATEGYLKSADLAGYATTEQLNGKLNTSDLATELAETANANAVKNIISADTTVAKTSDLSGYAALSSGKISTDVLPAGTVVDSEYATVKTNAANALKTLPENVVTTGIGGKISADVIPTLTSDKLPANTVIDADYATVKTNAANALKTLPDNVVTTGTGGKISADVIPTLTSDKLPTNTVIDADYATVKTNATNALKTLPDNVVTTTGGKISTDVLPAGTVVDSEYATVKTNAANALKTLPENVVTTGTGGKISADVIPTLTSDKLPANTVIDADYATVQAGAAKGATALQQGALNGYVQTTNLKTAVENSGALNNYVTSNGLTGAVNTAISQNNTIATKDDLKDYVSKDGFSDALSDANVVTTGSGGNIATVLSNNNVITTSNLGDNLGTAVEEAVASEIREQGLVSTTNIGTCVTDTSSERASTTCTGAMATIFNQLKSAINAAATGKQQQ